MIDLLVPASQNTRPLRRWPRRRITQAIATAILTLALPLMSGACTSKKSGSIVPPNLTPTIQFTEIHAAAGLDFVHGFRSQRSTIQPVTGGVAAADYDKDKDIDLYVLTGDVSGNLLYRNKGDGTFEEVGEKAGVRIAGGAWCGATFVDMNGDSFLDLFVGSVADAQPCVLLNQQDGTFVDATLGSGFENVNADNFSAAFGDYDKDGDLDLFITQWRAVYDKSKPSQHLWANDGKAAFTDVSLTSGITAALASQAQTFVDLSFTPNFVDVNNDGWPDLVITADQGKNTVLINDRLGGFTNATNSVLVSEHASGAAIGDYDNDGDLDWFTSGVYTTNKGVSAPLTGNRLYNNQGDGTFQDHTDLAGVRIGGWGWASSFADFDNDGDLDIIQVNGYGTSPTSNWGEFFRDPARLFMSNGDGTFTEKSAELKLDDLWLGRGIAVADFDRDGDLDIFIANSLGEPSLWRNDGGNRKNYLTVRLQYRAGNYRGIGARIKITAGGKSQIRELRGGSHYVSQNPVEAHFGLGDQTTVDLVEVTWPDGNKTTETGVATNRLLQITR